MDGGQIQAAELMAAARYGEAIPLLIAACGAHGAPRQCWVDLGHCLIEAGQHAGFFALVEKRQAVAADGLRLYYDCLFELLSTGRYTALNGIIAATPRNSLLFVVALYVSGVLACQGAEAQRGIEAIRLASAAAQRSPAAFEGDPLLTSMLHEGELLEDFTAIAAIEARGRSAALAGSDAIAPTAVFAPAPAPAIEMPYVFLAGCSEPYLDRFGSGLVAALDAIGARTVLHFHVADPSPAIGEKIVALDRACRHLQLRFSTEDYRHPRRGYGRASFYACARLIRLSEILAHYGCDVMMWDMDATAVRDAHRLVAAMKDSDLGYFEMSNQRVPLICHLAVAYFANTAAMRRCAELVGAYAALKVDETPYWLLDQSSLFCASRYLRDKIGLRINDFMVDPGGEFERYVTIAGSAGEKQGMRKDARAA